VFVSIVVVVSYHKVNQYGQQIAALGRVDPAISLWLPFVLLGAWIGWMYYRVAFVPGGQAIGGLEAGYAKLARQIRKLWRRRDRKAGIATEDDVADEEGAVVAV
jgi:lipopolysaccharide export system permease protein